MIFSSHDFCQVTWLKSLPRSVDKKTNFFQVTFLPIFNSVFSAKGALQEK